MKLVMRHTKRYLLYSWDRDKQESYINDYDIELNEVLEAGRRDIIDYGTFLGEFDIEDEANECVVKQVDYYDVVSIYDTVEKYWFN